MNQNLDNLLGGCVAALATLYQGCITYAEHNMVEKGPS